MRPPHNQSINPLHLPVRMPTGAVGAFDKA